MSAIASEAGVALKTVYLAFETKSGLLRAVWHLLLRGDEEEAPVAERPWYRQVLEEPDAERQIHLTARNSRMVKERAAALMEVIREAAPAAPDLQTLWSRIQSDFYENQRTIVQTLHDKRALRPELDVDRATDILWTLNHPNLWQLLIVQRRWTPEEYEQWFAETCVEQLLKANETRP